MDPDGVTGQLCTWIVEFQLADVPDITKTRVKHLILDGLACALHGARLQWSELAVHGVLDMEGEGWCGLVGREEKLGPLPAALLNSTFIQAFELDDYHSEASIHSASVVLPFIFATA